MVALMFLMNCLSHGTQDLYPDFLKHGHGLVPNTVAYITVFYNVGAVTGAVLFGLLSEKKIAESGRVIKVATGRTDTVCGD